VPSSKITDKFPRSPAKELHQSSGFALQNGFRLAAGITGAVSTFTTKMAARLTLFSLPMLAGIFLRSGQAGPRSGDRGAADQPGHRKTKNRKQLTEGVKY